MTNNSSGDCCQQHQRKSLHIEHLDSTAAHQVKNNSGQKTINKIRNNTNFTTSPNACQSNKHQNAFKRITFNDDHPEEQKILVGRKMSSDNATSSLRGIAEQRRASLDPSYCVPQNDNSSQPN